MWFGTRGRRRPCEDCSASRRAWRWAVAGALFAVAVPGTALGPSRAQEIDPQSFAAMYPPSEIARDGARLATAVRKIWTIGLQPALTRSERQRLGDVRFEFPAPRTDDPLMNYYAYRDRSGGVIVMPTLSLKALEDLTTAYAWLHTKGHSLSTIDLYYAMLRHRFVFDWPDGRYADILSALGVPKDAYKLPGVDTMSLALRNEAFAFIIAHEAGHLLYRHKPYRDITTAQARADELQSDRFALDLLVRTNTPPMGAALFFQAQAYHMPHRGEFDSHDDWAAYLKTVSTHPLSTARIDNIANTTATDFARRRPSEAATWRFIGNGFRKIAAILEDVDIQRCIKKTATAATATDLSPTKTTVGLADC